MRVYGLNGSGLWVALQGSNSPKPVSWNLQSHPLVGKRPFSMWLVHAMAATTIPA